MPIRIFVGSDIWQHAAGAESVLEHSIRKHTKSDVEFTWMRAGPHDHENTAPGFAISEKPKDGCWTVHRPIDHAWPKTGWGTPFSTFRAAVPELLGFEGTGIYLDADMMVLGDVQELIDFPRNGPWFCNHPRITDVSVFEASHFKQPWWPRISTMMKQGTYLNEVRVLAFRRNLMDTRLPWCWNARDEWNEDTKLIHMTSVPHQPYRPYPKVAYKQHPDRRIGELYFQFLQELSS